MGHEFAGHCRARERRLDLAHSDGKQGGLELRFDDDFARRGRHYYADTYFESRPPRNCRMELAMADMNEAMPPVWRRTVWPSTVSTAIP